MEWEGDAIDIREMQDMRPEKPRGLLFDPYQVITFLNEIQKPTTLSFELLRAMSYKCKPVRAIVQTRKNQISNFCRPVRNKSEMGFKISMKSTQGKPNDSILRRMKEVEFFLSNCGFPARTANMDRRDNFETFVRKLVEDRLVLDATTFERTYDRRGLLAEVIAVDGATIRRVINKEAYQMGRQDLANQTMFTSPFNQFSMKSKLNVEHIEDVKYVQIIKGNVVAEFSERELVYGIANPRTDINALGYGMSELEVMVDTVTAHLFAEQYNRAFFTQGSIPPGVLSLIGNYDQEMLEAFKRQWMMQVSGVQNAWKLPVIAMTEGDGFKYTPFNQSSRDMEYHLWITYLIAVACSLYQIDPEEIGFQGYRPQAGGALFQQSGEYRIEQSKDRGLRPLMIFMQNLINKEIVELIYPDLMFEWANFDEKTEAEKIDIHTKELQAGLKTVNMIRAEDDEEEINESWANAPANPALLQVYMKEQEMAQQEMMQEQQTGQQVEEAETQNYLANKYPEMYQQQGGEENKQPPKKGSPPKKGAAKKTVKKSMTGNEVILEFEL
jgi:hypothetical protein